MAHKRIEVIVKLKGSNRIYIYSKHKTPRLLTTLIVFESFYFFLAKNYKDNFFVISNLKPTNNRRTKTLKITSDDCDCIGSNKKDVVIICTPAIKSYFGYIPKKFYFQFHNKLNTKSNLIKYETKIEQTQIRQSCCNIPDGRYSPCGM